LSSASVMSALVAARRAIASTSSLRPDIPVRSTTTPSPTFPPPMALPAPRGMSAIRCSAAQDTSVFTPSLSEGRQIACGRIR
jgi:hypothetical protein